jgi:hypothetical protein
MKAIVCTQYGQYICRRVIIALDTCHKEEYRDLGADQGI